MSVIDKDMGYQTIITNLSRLEGTVKVGIMADAGSEKDGASLVEVATYNEFGTQHIPARPFVRQTTDNNRRAWGSMAARLEDRVAHGMSPHQALEILGNKAEGDMKATIGRGHFVPNAPNTIKQKGSSQPLIDTGRMRNSVSHKVED
jgi:hypothetical protein